MRERERHDKAKTGTEEKRAAYCAHLNLGQSVFLQDEFQWYSLADEDHWWDVIAHLVDGEDAVAHHVRTRAHKGGEDEPGTVTQRQLVALKWTGGVDERKDEWMNKWTNENIKIKDMNCLYMKTKDKHFSDKRNSCITRSHSRPHPHNQPFTRPKPMPHQVDSLEVLCLSRCWGHRHSLAATDGVDGGGLAHVGVADHPHRHPPPAHAQHTPQLGRGEECEWEWEWECVWKCVRGNDEDKERKKERINGGKKRRDMYSEMNNL